MPFEIELIIMFTSQVQGTHSDYILQQAHERSFELLLQTHQQVEKLKNKLITEGKEAVNDEYKKRNRQAHLQKQIYMNVLTNQHKLRRLKARFLLCEKIYQEIQTRLKTFTTEQSTSGEYQLFLISSIVEGLIRMFEESVDLRCLERDKVIIQKLIPEIQQIYRQFMVSNIGFESPLQLKMAANFTLQERNPELGPLLKNKEDLMSIGGVILADRSGNITFKATLDSRLNILKENCLPIIRELVWNHKSDAQNRSQ